MDDNDPFGPTEADKARLARELAEYDSPAAVAKREERRKQEFEKGVRLGWWDADGEPIQQDNDDEEEDEDDEQQDD